MPRYDDDYDDDDDRRAPRVRRRRHEDEDEEDDRDRRDRRRRRRDDEDDYDFRTRSQPHSGAGIVSCVLALLVLVCGVLAMLIAASAAEEDFEVMMETDPAIAGLFVLFFLGGGLLTLIGLVLGIVGLAQQDRNKVFAILGLCANGLFLLCGLGLMVLGMMVG
jgi:hypothetical protein